MKKLSLICLPALFLSSFVYAQRMPVPPAEQDNHADVIAANHIHFESIYTYTTEDKKDSSLLVRIEYNDSGKPVRKEQSQVTETYRYNDKGQLRKYVRTNFNSGEVTNEEYEYDSAGHELNAYEYNKDTTRLTTHKKEYNSKGQLTAVYIRRNASDFHADRAYYYNEEGKLTKTDVFGAEGGVSFSYTFEYDTHPDSRTEYLENQQGQRRTGQKIYNKSGRVVTVKSWTRGPFLGSRYRGQGEVEIRADYLYNPDGTLAQQNSTGIEKKRGLVYYYEKW